MRFVSLIAVFGLMFFTSGCGQMLKSKQTAETAAAAFHKQYNDGEWTAIYTNSHPKFQATTTEKQFNDLLGAVNRKLGKARQSVSGGFKIQSFNLTTSVVLSQTSTFEQGTGTETFTFEMSGDKPVLLGYFINSADMMLK